MRKNKKFGIIFYSFVTIFLALSLLFGVLSIYLIVRNNFELYYFTPLLFDLFIAFIFVCIVSYLCNQILDVNSNSDMIRVILRNGRTHDISKQEDISYSANYFRIKVKYDINNSLVIYKNISYYNDSTRRLLSMLDSHHKDELT
jgi:hypothetical protein